MIVLLLVGGVARAMLPWFVRDYVNRTLDRNPLYAGTIGEVDIHLWRGAYSIQDVRISKTTGNTPVPLFSAERVDFAMQWDALMHGEIVGRVLMEQPEINFVDSADETGDQTGAGAPWLQMIKDLFPFRINSAVVHDGSIHFRAFQAETPVNVYLSDVEATIDNLTNIRDEINRLFESPYDNNGGSDVFNAWAPALDLFEEKDNLVVRAELPGMKKEDIDLSLHDNVITVSGERKNEKKYAEGETSREERFFGRFTRSMKLPKQVDITKVKASYKDGVLTVTLPKAEEAKPRQIEIKA